ncbi:unnamed protein product [Orchesella dallaii]|uniref:Diacylglycerol O-acyltransferase n=1 Tax=Orchesella dallaii TaxID=48710 RepID=A0ABP1Q4L1_9HEXA
MFRKLKETIFVLLFSFLTSLLLIPWFIIFLVVRQTVILLAKIYRSDFGNILPPLDTLMGEEDYTINTPKTSLVCTLKLKGDLSGQELCTLFNRTVLEATIKTSSQPKKTVPRYPELKQCQVDFMGYKFWKNDTNFKLETHIFEQKFQTTDLISNIHEEALNKLYKRKQSPWEIIVIRNYHEKDETDSKKTVLVARFHYSMADAKSILKLLVECLGQKPITFPNTQRWEPSYIDRLWIYIAFPWRFISQICFRGVLNSARNLDHPWRLRPICLSLPNNDFRVRTTLSYTNSYAQQHLTFESYPYLRSS